MLIRFTLKNWRSFRDEVTFSMVASKERQHGKRLPMLKKYRTRVLPVAAIYGGNAAGKTNLFRALSFAKRFVVSGKLPEEIIPVEPFRLDDISREKPSSFRFEVLAEENIFEFSFSADWKRVYEEKMVSITSSGEKTLYHRTNDGGFSIFNSDQRLNFAFQGTRDNQLFLTNTVSQKLDYFLPVYNWFKNTLELVAPDSRFEPFEQFLDESSPLYTKMNQALRALDTGIDRVGGEIIPFDKIPVPPWIKERISLNLKDGKSIRLQGEQDSSRFVVARKAGKLIAKKLVSCHTKNDGSEVKFEIEDESDGSKRAIDLLPAFLDLSIGNSKKVYIIDEVDRSLHTLLTRGLLEAYLSTCSADTRNQLLMTTHDVLLMDQNLLRRDEMWVTERCTDGVSSLCSFCEFDDVRYDKNVRKSYLQGRLGGVPKIFLTKAFGNEA